MIKTQRSRNRRNFFNMIKNIIILKDERLNAFFPRNKARMVTLTTAVQHGVEVLAGSVRKEKEIKE